LFMAIYINELKNRSNHKIASKQLPNGKYWDPCFLPTPFGLRTNIILITNGICFKLTDMANRHPAS
ncbi:MAG: hypothetical protein Q8O31_08610, partial [Rhodocyclaceae bacterium]|nr:hypothetical protein [Rhodocyclaceae bacterium]